MKTLNKHEKHVETVTKFVGNIPREGLAEIAKAKAALDALTKKNPLYVVANSSTGLLLFATQDWQKAVTYVTSIFSRSIMEAGNFFGSGKSPLFDMADLSVICLYDPQPGKNDMHTFIKTSAMKIGNSGRSLVHGVFDIANCPHEKNSFCVGLMTDEGSSEIEEGYSEISDGLYMRCGHTDDESSSKFSVAFGLNVELTLATQSAIVDDHGVDDLREILASNVTSVGGGLGSETFQGWNGSEVLKLIGDSFAHARNDAAAMSEVRKTVIPQILGVRS